MSKVTSRILRAVGARTRVADDTLLVLYSYFTPTLLILYSYFTPTLLIRILRAVGARTRVADDAPQYDLRRTPHAGIHTQICK